VLIANGADPMAVDSAGETALHMLARRSCYTDPNGRGVVYTDPNGKRHDNTAALRAIFDSAATVATRLCMKQYSGLSMYSYS
jgi:hypothetical protein